MRHEVQVRLIKQLETHLDAGTNVDAGGLMLNPTRVYVDPELAEREWNEFFVHHPQIVGLSGDLAAPGSFMTIDDLGVPILTTRDNEGRFRAFVNACRHRGAVVENRERGDDATSFSCPFHNWTYSLEGTLIGLTKGDHFGDVDTSCRGLVELPAAERHGILWIHPDPAGTIDVDALLGDELSDEFESWNFDSLRYLGGDTYDVACNWKLAMDTFGETYHFPVLHSKSLNLTFHGNVQCYDTFGRNHRMLLCRREIDDMLKLPENEWRVTTAGLPAYWLFPNVQLLPSEFGAFLVRAYPTPGQTGRHVSRISFYVWPGTEAGSSAETAVRTISEMFASIIRDEDYVVAASQQRSANAGSLEHVLFGRNEPALHHYHSTYRAALGMPPLPLLDDHDVA
ncbi:MAG: aromatic ring-hydroxylating dioxygenase subunit alpha [Chloroflexi bacterium]|nr:aromatic ring-hydroxylating dioxygenase subunit alpha [Chloroflexota bacterium]